MLADSLDLREAMLWRRVGTLACIMGAGKTDNPFRKYGAILGHGAGRDATIERKQLAWDQGWDSVHLSMAPRPRRHLLAYRPCTALPRAAVLVRKP